MLDALLDDAKAFVTSLNNDRAVGVDLDVLSTEHVKFYASQTPEYSALFAIISLPGPTKAQSMQIINVYGKFDHALLGGSVNVPVDILEATVPQHPLLKQMTVYREDAAGAAFFAKPTAPPACDEFNYSLMIMGNGGDDVNIFSSSWQIGDAAKYSLKISELVPLSLDSFQLASSWCRGVLPPPALAEQRPVVEEEQPRDTKSRTNMVLWASVAFLIVFVYWAVTLKPSRLHLSRAVPRRHLRV